MKQQPLKQIPSRSPTLRELHSKISQQRPEIKPVKPLPSLFSGGRLQVSQNFDTCIRILIPTTVDVQVTADSSQFVERANLLLSRHFGGTMCKLLLGFYESENQNIGLVKETIFEVEAWTNEAGWKQAEAALEEFLTDILVELRQETVFLAVNNEVYLLKLSPDQTQAA